MLNPVRKFVVAASLCAGIASLPNVASALPMLDPLTIKNAAPPAVEQVQWRRGWGGGWGWGAPVAAGVVAGAVVGSAVAASAYGPYYPGPYYPAPAYGYPAYAAPPPGYGYPPPVAGPPGGYPPPPGASSQSAGDPVSYCMQRYRSYDTHSGTYLGTDGQRHPCP
ncbi:MAG: BA14K family protein [Xanthobacteraceae bacterium]